MISIFSKINIGWDYAWWFPAAYALLTLTMIAIYGKVFSRKFFHIPSSKSLKQKIPYILGAALFGRALMVFSIFIPLKLNTTWFWIGILIFLVGTVLSAIAMVTFARTPEDQPVTKGFYRLSRHPIQLLAIIMWIGVGIATTSWIILAACLLLAFVSYPSFLAQEKYCLQEYGETYQEYMNSTPRYLSFESQKK
jgi:protein-S-isoprenylcysteine O-methyltransferase Ste14